MKRLDINEYAAWSHTLDVLTKKAVARRGLRTEEYSFFAEWWMSIEDGAEDAYKRALQLRSEGLLS